MRVVPPSDHAIETVGLSRRYGKRWALVDVEIAIGHGAAVMVAGRNGSGKSTLFRILSTAIRPDYGTVTVEGFDSRTDRYEIRNRVALLSHYSYLYEALSAFENLQVVARLVNQPSRREDLLPFLARVHLEKRADDPVMTFSAGMRKRLSLARILLQSASVVLLDEPYGQLDPAGFVFVDRMIEELVGRGATVLMATHQVDRAVALCGEGIMLDAGRVVARGSSDEIARRSRASVEREEPRSWS
jgi:heme exporter protein A